MRQKYRECTDAFAIYRGGLFKNLNGTLLLNC